MVVIMPFLDIVCMGIAYVLIRATSLVASKDYWGQVYLLGSLVFAGNLARSTSRMLWHGPSARGVIVVVICVAGGWFMWKQLGKKVICIGNTYTRTLSPLIFASLPPTMEEDYEKEDVFLEEEEFDDAFSAKKRVSRVVTYGRYRGALFFLFIIWAVFTAFTIWITRSINPDHTQLRTPSHKLDTFNSTRYYTPAWWALALPMFWRPLVVVFACWTLLRSFHAAPSSMLSWALGFTILFEAGVLAYFISERWLLGCTQGVFPSLVCHPLEWCHVNYKAHRASCSNERPLLIPPVRGMQPRFEWYLLTIIAAVHLIAAISMAIIVWRTGYSKPAEVSREVSTTNYQELWYWHWALLVIGLLTCTALYTGVAVRLIRMDFLYVRSQSASNPILNSRYGIVWIIHALGCITLPVALYTGSTMLMSTLWSPMIADVHRWALRLTVVDCALRLIMSTINLNSCNGAMLYWSNTCNSRRLCCLRFEEWPANPCAGVGLLYGNGTTPENYVWACDPPLLSPKQLDRDVGFTWVYAVTGFTLLSVLALLWNLSHLRSWHRELERSSDD